MTPVTERLYAPPLRLDLIWQQDLLAGTHIAFAQADARPTQTDALSPSGRIFLRELAAYVNGQKPNWPQIRLQTHGLASFSANVLETLQGKVPYGKTVSYGQLAAMSGHPGAARAVGGVMRGNPWPLLIPCHRVLAANGTLRGFGGGLDLKAWLLRREGAAFTED